MPTTTYQIANVNDVSSLTRAGASYPPSGSVQPGGIVVFPIKKLAAGTYQNQVSLFRFLISVPSDGVVESISLKLNPLSKTDADTRSLQGEWRTPTFWPPTSDEHSDAGGNDAFTVTIASVTTGSYNTITLSNFSAKVPAPGATAYMFLRLTISGAAPTGTNQVDCRSGSNPATEAPQLVVVVSQVQAPTNLAPVNEAKVASGTIRLSWRHVESNGLAQSKFDVQHSTNGGSSWTTVTQTTPNEYWDAPGGTWAASSTVTWRVRTYDANGQVGPYAIQVSFTAGAAASTPTVTAPSTPIALTRPTVTWTSSGQSSYRVRVRVSAASTFLWDSGEIAGAATSKQIGVDLVDATAYDFLVSIKNSDGVWSAEGTRTATTGFVPGAQPTISVSAQTSNGRNQIVSTQPLTNELQTLSVTGGTPTSGNFQLTFSGQTTANIAFNAAASAVQSALEALSNIAPGDVIVTGGPFPGTAIKVEFTGAYAATNVALMTATDTFDVGDVSIAETMAGAQDILVSHELWRQYSDETASRRVAVKTTFSGSPKQATFYDRGARAGIQATYFVRATFSNGTVRNSTSSAITLNIANLWLHDVAEADTVVPLKLPAYEAQGADEWQAFVAIHQFKGRTFPVTEWGTQEMQTLRISFQMPASEGQFATLRTLLKRKSTLCARIPRGYVYFGVVPRLPREFDELMISDTVTLELQQNDFTEDI